MKKRRAFLAVALLVSVALAPFASAQRPAPREVEPDEAGQEQRLNRELWEARKRAPYEAALRHARRGDRGLPAGAGTVALPNGWKLAPAGALTPVGRLPFEAVAFAGKVVVLNTGYYDARREKSEVSIVDPETGQLERVLHFDSLFPSAVVQNGYLYVSGGYSRKVYQIDRTFRVVRTYELPGQYTGGLAPADAGRLAVVSLAASPTPAEYDQGRYGEGRLSLLNVGTGTIEADARVGYFPYAVRRVGGKLYALVLGEDRVQVFDGSLQPVRSIRVGRTPQDLAVAGTRIYVVNSGSDDLSVIDAGRDEVVRTIRLDERGRGFGKAPVACVAAGERLYVSLANHNAVAVIDERSGKTRGYIPTGWYPTRLLADRTRLLVLSAKGVRSRRPNVDGPQPREELGGPQYVLTLLHGALARIPLREIPRRLGAWTRRVSQAAPGLAPRAPNAPPIRYVFYIVRENRSYDQILGDLPRGERDPFLTLFGRDVTPNGHELARRFVTLDHYFVNGEISVLGHSYTTSGYASPFLQWLGNTRYSGKYRGYPFGTVPAVTSPAYLWDRLRERGVDFRIFGENYYLYTRAWRLLQEELGRDSEPARKFYARSMELATRTDRGAYFYQFAHAYAGRADTPQDAEKLLEDPVFTQHLSEFLTGDGTLRDALAGRPGLRRKLAEYLSHYAFDYRSWDLGYSDLDRARAWRDDFQRQLRRRQVARLQYIWLPNDHTGGTNPANLPPEQLVAQNDAALGRIIETIAAQPEIWKQSLILVTEDDAQDGPDHVDATRSVCLAAGPYVRRGAFVSERYDQLSLLRTIELLLGLPPLNHQDRLAVPMFGIFTRTPDRTPYRPTPPSRELSAADRERYRAWDSPGG